MSFRKVAHEFIRGTIVLESGMRIGGSDDMLQIGGTDLTCLRDPVSGRPYIPGSSLKGKMRSCLERELGKTSNREPCGCAGEDCPVCRVFGPHKKADHELGPTRIIVRDAMLADGFQLENKTESTNNRKTGAAVNPRTVERVAPGATFEFEIAVQAFEEDREFGYCDPENNPKHGIDALKEVVEHALTLVEDTGIGAGVGKGYGKVKITVTQDWMPVRRRRLDRDPQAPVSQSQ